MPFGDKANTWILNAFEKAAEANGWKNSRHRSEHAQILIEEDIPRFAQLVSSLPCSPHTA